MAAPLGNDYNEIYTLEKATDLFFKILRFTEVSKEDLTTKEVLSKFKIQRSTFYYLTNKYIELKELKARIIKNTKGRCNDGLIPKEFKKLNNTFQSNLRVRLKSRGMEAKGAFKKLPYSIIELGNHLESLFDDKMNWDNIGSYWEIDHMTPDSWFNYHKIESAGFKMSWCLSNLQPLEASKNRLKGSKHSG